jgi:hypothetical protein
MQRTQGNRATRRLIQRTRHAALRGAASSPLLIQRMKDNPKQGEYIKKATVIYKIDKVDPEGVVTASSVAGDKATITITKAEYNDYDDQVYEYTISKFKKDHEVAQGSGGIEALGQPIVTDIPQPQSPPHGTLGYVANVLTTPGIKVSTITQKYAEQAFADKAALASRFAMVIGVNKYKSLSETSEQAVRDTIDSTSAPFPLTVIPFLWQLNWDRNFNFAGALADYKKLSPADQELARAYEKSHIQQAFIPYGLLREQVTGSAATTGYVGRLKTMNDSVYIYLGDADAVSMVSSPAQSGMNTGQPSGLKNDMLLDRYDEVIAAQTKQGRLPVLVVGGYEFRLNNMKGGGDLDASSLAEVLTALANQLDIEFRKVLAKVAPEAVYPTEPNLAFLAANKEAAPLAKMLEPKPNKYKKSATDLDKPHIYGLGTNEGKELRENIKAANPLPQEKGAKLTKAPKGPTKTASEAPAPIIVYDPRLAIATGTDKRFKLTNEAETPYESRRRDAAAKGTDEFFKEVIEQMASQKQSHIGGLVKEIGDVLKSKEANELKAQLIAKIRDTVRPPEDSDDESEVVVPTLKKEQAVKAPAKGKAVKPGASSAKKKEVKAPASLQADLLKGLETHFATLGPLLKEINETIDKLYELHRPKNEPAVALPKQEGVVASKEEVGTPQKEDATLNV